MLMWVMNLGFAAGGEAPVVVPADDELFLTYPWLWRNWQAH